MAEQQKELRDYSYSKFWERYQELLDEHKPVIERELREAYSKFCWSAKDYAKYRDYGIVLCGLPSLVLFAIATEALPKGFVTAIIIVVLLLAFATLFMWLSSRYEDRLCDNLFREYELKRVVTEYVRREERYTKRYLINSKADSLDRLSIRYQYSDIEDFYDKCLKNLLEEQFKYKQ